MTSFIVILLLSVFSIFILSAFRIDDVSKVFFSIVIIAINSWGVLTFFRPQLQHCTDVPIHRIFFNAFYINSWADIHPKFTLVEDYNPHNRDYDWDRYRVGRFTSSGKPEDIIPRIVTLTKSNGAITDNLGSSSLAEGQVIEIPSTDITGPKFYFNLDKQVGFTTFKMSYNSAIELMWKFRRQKVSIDTSILKAATKAKAGSYFLPACRYREAWSNYGEWHPSGYEEAWKTAWPIKSAAYYPPDNRLIISDKDFGPNTK